MGRPAVSSILAMSGISVSTDRSLTGGATRVVDEMVVMLGEMEIHDIRVGELARRAGVAIPTIYYSFRSLNDIIAEATVDLLHRFLVPYSEALSDMGSAVQNDDAAKFQGAALEFIARSWSSEANDGIHRLAPLIAYFRQIAPEDVRLRTVQAREVAGLISVLMSAQGKGWIDCADDATAFVIVHWTCVLGQAVFYHPSFGALTTIDFSTGVGHLKYQTALRSDISQMSVTRNDPDERGASNI
jgi:AcrR family transcriptional regulator